MVPHMVLRELNIPFTAVRMRFTVSELICNGDRYEIYAECFDTFSQPDKGGYDPIDDISREDFFKLSPDGYVPTLTSEGEALTELPAILTYLAELAPERSFLGSTPWERGKVMSWLNWLSGTMHTKGFAGQWRPMRFSDDESTWPAIQAKSRKTVDAGYERIESRLVTRSHAVGDNLTVVEFFLHTMWRWGRTIGIPIKDMESRYPNWAKLMREVEGRESVRAAMAEEGQELTF